MVCLVRDRRRLDASPEERQGRWSTFPLGIRNARVSQTQHPRADLLGAIVESYEVDPRWLLTGKSSEAWAEDRIRAEAAREAKRLVARMAEEYGPKKILER